MIGLGASHVSRDNHLEGQESQQNHPHCQDGCDADCLDNANRIGVRWVLLLAQDSVTHSCWHLSQIAEAKAGCSLSLPHDTSDPMGGKAVWEGI